jgi:hypothetical protein
MVSRLKGSRLQQLAALYALSYQPNYLPLVDKTTKHLLKNNL